MESAALYCWDVLARASFLSPVQISATASEEVLNGRGCWAWLGLILDAFQCVYQFLGLGDSYEAGEVCIYMTVMKLVHRASVVGGLERAECKCTVVMSCQ